MNSSTDSVVRLQERSWLKHRLRQKPHLAAGTEHAVWPLGENACAAAVSRKPLRSGHFLSSPSAGVAAAVWRRVGVGHPASGNGQARSWGVEIAGEQPEHGSTHCPPLRIDMVFSHSSILVSDPTCSCCPATSRRAGELIARSSPQPRSRPPGGSPRLKHGGRRSSTPVTRGPTAPARRRGRLRPYPVGSSRCLIMCGRTGKPQLRPTGRRSPSPPVGHRRPNGSW